MRRLRRATEFDLATWCEDVRRDIPLLAIFNDDFLFRLIERPLEALELDRGDPQRMLRLVADGDNFPGRSFTAEGFAAVQAAVERAHADGITARELAAARNHN
jgi:hypothetical protein